MVAAEARRAYDTAEIDRITGQRTLITGRRVPRDVALRIALSNIFDSALGQPLDAADRQPDAARPGQEANPSEGLDRDIAAAIERGILPEIDLARLGFSSAMGVFPFTDFNSTKLERISDNTGEGIVFRPPGGDVVYKFFMPYNYHVTGERHVSTMAAVN
jgi:hypothetical protein